MDRTHVSFNLSDFDDCVYRLEDGDGDSRQGFKGPGWYFNEDGGDGVIGPLASKNEALKALLTYLYEI